MTYERFEDLPVWKAGIDLGVQVYALTAKSDFKGYGSLRDQLERAALSVSNNIAEGFERGTTQELLNFLYIARGSAGEVRSMLCFLERLGGFENLESEISNLKSLGESVSRQLRGWAGSLQNSEIPGQRRLTEKSARVFKAKQDWEEYWERAKREREEFLERLQATRQANPAALKS